MGTLTLILLLINFVALYSKNIFIEEKIAKSSLRVKRGSMFRRSNLERECVESDCTQEEYLEGAENFIPRKKLTRSKKNFKRRFDSFYKACVNKCNKKNIKNLDIIVCQQHLTKNSGVMVFIDFNGTKTEVDTKIEYSTEIPILHDIPVADGFSLRDLSSEKMYERVHLKAWNALNFGALCGYGFERNNDGLFTNFNGGKEGSGWMKSFESSIRRVEEKYSNQIEICYFPYNPKRDDECRKLARHCQNSKIYKSRCLDKPEKSLNDQKLDEILKQKNN